MKHSLADHVTGQIRLDFEPNPMLKNARTNPTLDF